MTTTTQTAPVRPADLSLFELHSPATVRKWQDDTAAYFAAMQAIEHAKEIEAHQAEQERTRPLTDLEYWNAAQAREAENQAKAREAAKAKQAEADAKAAYLASRPPSVEIMRSDPFNFLQEFAHWSRAGYEMHSDGMHSTVFGLWHATLVAPAGAPAAKAGK